MTFAGKHAAGPLGSRPRIGIDLGGTKIAGVLLDQAQMTRAEHRIATPREDYAATIRAVRDLVAWLEQAAGTPPGAQAMADQTRARATVGVGIPGSISPASGRVQNANSTWLNGQPFDADLAEALDRPVRLANDANCFALSEATDGAGMGYASVFGVILGTGCGGGIVCHGQLIDGPRGIGGEWGHNPLPWGQAGETPGPRCWCGRNGCMETWVSGPGLSADHRAVTGEIRTAAEIAEAASRNDPPAVSSLGRHAERLARGLAQVVNLIDPDVIVLGGGLSTMRHLYDQVPAMMTPYVFADSATVELRPPRWGDASGVRGAAWLWPATDDGGTLA